MTANPPAVSVRAVERQFVMSTGATTGLRAVSLVVERSTMVAVAGRSGSGKTTLLNLIGGLDTPTAGEIELWGRAVPPAHAAGSARWRAHTFGFVFQVDALIPTLSIAENADVMARIAGMPRRTRRSSVDAALELVGLGGRAHHRPHELSGGQRRRAALARAVCAAAPVLLADEPTAGLDSQTAGEMVALLRLLTVERGTTIVMATHDPLVIDACDAVFRLDQHAPGRTVGAADTDPSPGQVG